MEDLRIYDLGDLAAVYSNADGIISLLIVPASRKNSIKNEKLDLSYIKHKFHHVKTQSLFQIALRGDSGNRDFTPGISMKNSSSSYEFKPVGQEVVSQEDGTLIITSFDNGRGQTGKHYLRHRNGVDALESYCSVTNINGADTTVEMLASFNVSGLSPFSNVNDSDKLVLHQLISNWSAEGMLISRKLSELGLEDSWSRYGARINRIGQVGSMPARGYLPFTALEDTENGVIYAFSLECPASWQMEIYHHNGNLSLSGGIADFNFGHFAKKLKKGETFTTNSAFLTASDGGLMSAANKLTDYYTTRLNVPESEQSLPVIYNEYCCTWGFPSTEALTPLIEETAKYDIGYFVIDAGWYREENKNWHSLGDWRQNMDLFPDGIKSTVDKIKSHGMKSGIWFEFESVTDDSEVYITLKNNLLTRDGHIVKYNNRSFLDFRKPETIEYLSKKVIKFLLDNGFSYMKVDYNENVGLGADGSDSLGEGLRQHIDGVINFFNTVKKAVPDIVIEVCSSGGMRHEPKFLSIASQVSFSDAHEGPEGAVVAANLHRFMLPRQMQVWATLKKEYTAEKTAFVIATAMLGRYCLSGNIAELNDGQKQQISESIGFYKKISDIIKNGDTIEILQQGVTSYHNLKGAQALLRVSKNKKKAVLYVHSFDNADKKIVLDKLIKKFKCIDAFGCGKINLKENAVIIENETEANFAKIFLLEI